MEDTDIHFCHTFEPVASSKINLLSNWQDNAGVQITLGKMATQQRPRLPALDTMVIFHSPPYYMAQELEPIQRLSPHLAFLLILT